MSPALSCPPILNPDKSYPGLAVEILGSIQPQQGLPTCRMSRRARSEPLSLDAGTRRPAFRLPRTVLAGAWNLHRALEEHGHDEGLDFFLLTSSVSGSVGTATESNHYAANAFLDAFARWRRT